jgi:hypothetical protein
VDRETFCRSIGPDKYRNYLNYFYGVTIEEALLLATEEELLKADAGVFGRDSRAAEDAYQHLYGASVRRLRGEFSAERGLDARQPLAFDEYKEFTYWLFKRRVRTSHPARVASDTKKGLQALLRHRRDLDIPPPPVEEDLAARAYAEAPALENTAG